MLTVLLKCVLGQEDNGLVEYTCWSKPRDHGHVENKSTDVVPSTCSRVHGGVVELPSSFKLQVSAPFNEFSDRISVFVVTERDLEIGRASCRERV